MLLFPFLLIITDMPFNFNVTYHINKCVYSLIEIHTSVQFNVGYMYCNDICYNYLYETICEAVINLSK